MPASRVFWFFVGWLAAKAVFAFDTFNFWTWAAVAVYAIWFVGAVAITLDRKVAS